MFFAIPGAKQAWPNKEACWSPAMPPMGISAPKRSDVVCPYRKLDGRTSGSIRTGTPSAPHRLASHASWWMLKSIVREALL